MFCGLCPRLTFYFFKHATTSISTRRRLTTMAQSSPFISAVVASMRKLYPEVLADKAWDNTGLLLEAPYQSHHPRKSNSVLLTIDLTKAVADEAIKGNHSLVVAYHPTIFRGLKAITLGDTQQQSLLRLAGHGISVYSPHTAVDVVPGGMADWLCDIITGKLDAPEPQARTAEQKPQEPPAGDPRASSGSLGRFPGLQRTYSKPNYVPSMSQTFHPDIIPHTRAVITPSPTASIDAANSQYKVADGGEPFYSTKNTGAGRLVTFEEAQPLGALISRIAAAVGQPKAFPLAIPQGKTIEDISIKTIGLCPGSGSSVVRAAYPPPDLVFTGEVSHHEALAVIERGGSIISLFHSNSERGYLDAIMKPRLETELRRKWQETHDKSDGKISVEVSHWDRDPFGIVVLEDDEEMLDFGSPSQEAAEDEKAAPEALALPAATTKPAAEEPSKKPSADVPPETPKEAPEAVTKEMPEATPNEQPSAKVPEATLAKEATLKDGPKAAPKETNDKKPEESPKETPKETPKEMPKHDHQEDLKEASQKEAPKEATKGVSEKAPKEMPKEQPPAKDLDVPSTNEAPPAKEVTLPQEPKDAADEPPKATPPEAPKDTPKEAAKEKIKASPKETSKGAPIETSKGTPTKTPQDDPTEASQEAAKEVAEEQALGEAPSQETAKDTSKEKAKDAPAKAPDMSSAKEAPKEVAKAPAEEVQKKSSVEKPPPEKSETSPAKDTKESSPAMESPVKASASETPKQGTKDKVQEGVSSDESKTSMTPNAPAKMPPTEKQHDEAAQPPKPPKEAPPKEAPPNETAKEPSVKTPKVTSAEADEPAEPQSAPEKPKVQESQEAAQDTPTPAPAVSEDTNAPVLASKTVKARKAAENQSAATSTEHTSAQSTAKEDIDTEESEAPVVASKAVKAKKAAGNQQSSGETSSTAEAHSDPGDVPVVASKSVKAAKAAKNEQEAAESSNKEKS